MDDIYLIGGGASLKEFDFNRLRYKHCIAINKSISDVPWADYFITIDYTIRSKIDLRSIKTTKIFVVNYSKGTIKDVDGLIKDIKFNITYDLSDYDLILKSRAIDRFGFTFNDFRDGANSGYCALQFAIIMGYTNIHLLGYDLRCSEQTHYHDGYKTMNLSKMNNNLTKYSAYFKDAIINLKETHPEINIHSYDSTLGDITSQHQLNSI